MIQEFHTPKSWHLVKQMLQAGTIEEAFFKLRGILALKDLPPLQEMPKYALLSFCLCFPG